MCRATTATAATCGLNPNLGNCGTHSVYYLSYGMPSAPPATADAAPGAAHPSITADAAPVAAGTAAVRSADLGVRRRRVVRPCA